MNVSKIFLGIVILLILAVDISIIIDIHKYLMKNYFIKCLD